MAQFFDAHVLFFPVYSMVGPVWITSPVTLSRAGLSAPPEIVGGQVRLANTLQPAGHRLERLNLGWLLLPAGTDLAEADISNIRTLCDLPAEAPAIKEILGRLVLLPDELFSKVVNDNLEVRTSVSIDPATGAAEDKALFTYEALPRATVLYFDVVYNNPQHFQIGSEPIPHDISWVKENVEEGLALMQYLGVGGMNTRGMGRLQVLNLGRG
jgi:CRISPR-associated protein Cmr4